MHWQYSTASSNSPWFEPELKDKVGKLGSNPPTIALQHELASLSIVPSQVVLQCWWRAYPGTEAKGLTAKSMNVWAVLPYLSRLPKTKKI
jgi:hypothetical protein